MTTHTHAKPVGAPTWVDLLAPDIDAARTFHYAMFGWEYDIAGPEYGGYTPTSQKLSGRAALLS